jgi:hypothetical protein
MQRRAEDGGGCASKWGVAWDRSAAGDGGCGAVLLIHVVTVARASVGIGVRARELIGLSIRPRELHGVSVRWDVEVEVLL